MFKAILKKYLSKIANLLKLKNTRRRKDEIKKDNKVWIDNNNYLNLQNITFSYKPTKNILANLNLSVKLGECVAVLGSSGSGKSTLLNILVGFNPLQSGKIFLAGEDITEVVTEKRKIGLVFQDFALFPHLTVEKNIAFSLKKNNREEVNRLLKLIKLEHLRREYPHTLSGGEKQRVALARALAAKPAFLLLDEPFSNLDTNLKAELRMELKAILEESGISSILVTHDIEDARALANRIFELKDGDLQPVPKSEHEPS